MSTGVDRWADLRDREALGAELTDEELEECETLESTDVLAHVAAHSTLRPVQHGARVSTQGDESGLPLFDKED